MKQSSTGSLPRMQQMPNQDGMLGYYRKFVKDCSKKAPPSTRLTEKTVDFGVKKRKRYGSFLTMSWLELPFLHILTQRRILFIIKMPAGMA